MHIGNIIEKAYINIFAITPKLFEHHNSIKFSNIPKNCIANKYT